MTSTKPKKLRPKGGRCCSCGYDAEKETPCKKREDKIHCEHWWDGVPQPDGSAK